MGRKKLEFPKKLMCFRISKELRELMNDKSAEDSISITEFLNQAILLRSIINPVIFYEAERKSNEKKMEYLFKFLKDSFKK